MTLAATANSSTPRQQHRHPGGTEATRHHAARKQIEFANKPLLHLIPCHKNNPRQRFRPKAETFATVKLHYSYKIATFAENMPTPGATDAKAPC
jgi:hypothetical protein